MNNTRAEKSPPGSQRLNREEQAVDRFFELVARLIARTHLQQSHADDSRTDAPVAGTDMRRKELDR